MTIRFFSTVAALVLLGGMATAQSSVEGIISDLQAQGFTSFEVKNGATQSKVEAVRGTEQV
ncbi:MAG: PepSY domain-containing protein, partial [Rhodobacteraceae bacterium]|nr:PepSY domain-containing protein [Paracoccaceae bacterium]